jgi:hypothetical protein
MILNDESTRPPDVVEYLEQHPYETAPRGLRDILNAYTLHGYHCTRLTQQELDHILANGMQLPHRAMLCRRILRIQDDGLIDAGTAEKLQANNQADATNRAGMIWFCFFPPHIGGQNGIDRLVRFWGGEALYGLHDQDPVIGPISQHNWLPLPRRGRRSDCEFFSL